MVTLRIIHLTLLFINVMQSKQLNRPVFIFLISLREINYVFSLQLFNCCYTFIVVTTECQVLPMDILACFHFTTSISAAVCTQLNRLPITSFSHAVLDNATQESSGKRSGGAARWRK